MQHLSCPLRRGWAGQCLVLAASWGVAGGLADPAKMLADTGSSGVTLTEPGVPGTVPRVTDLVYVSFDKFQGLFLS